MHNLKLEVSPPKKYSGFSRRLQQNEKMNLTMPEKSEKRIPSISWHTKSVMHGTKNKTLKLNVHHHLTVNNSIRLRCIGDSMNQFNCLDQMHSMPVLVNYSVSDLTKQIRPQSSVARCRPSTAAASESLEPRFIRVCRPGTAVTSAKPDPDMQWHIAQPSFVRPPAQNNSTTRQVINCFCKEKVRIYSRWKKFSKQIMHASDILREVGFLELGTRSIHPIRRMFLHQRQTANSETIRVKL